MSVAGRKGKSKPNQAKQQAARVGPIKKKKTATAISSAGPSGGSIKKPHRFRPGTVASRDAYKLTFGARKIEPSIRWRPMQRLINQVIADRTGTTGVDSISRQARFLLHFEICGYMHRRMLRYHNSMDPKRQRLTPANIARVRILLLPSGS